MTIRAPIRGKIIDSNGYLTRPWLEYFRENDINSGNSQYVIKNPDILGGTHTKITYDEKGLVTAGSNATTADIPQSGANKYYSNNYVASLIVNGQHLTWTYNPNAPFLKGDVLVTLQNAFDDSVSFGIAELDIGTSQQLIFKGSFNTDNDYLMVGT